MMPFLEQHSGELTILMLSAILLGTLLLLVPHLLRTYQRSWEMQHDERMRALEVGQRLPPPDGLARAAGRTASLVPMVVVCAAGTVTCFLVAYKAEELFRVALAVWTVAGVVGLAAITGGVALMGRLAQLDAGEAEDEQLPHNPLRSHREGGGMTG